MSRRWRGPALGFGLSLVFHGAAFFGATLMAVYPHPWCCEPDPPEFTACPVVPPMVRVIEPGERPRECFDWASRRWKGPAVADDAYSIDPEAAHGRAQLCRAAENAVIAALRWLARHQQPGGGWSDDLRSCSCGSGQGDTDEEITVLALRAFHLAGHGQWSRRVYVDPAFPQRDLHFGKVVEDGRSFLKETIDLSDPAPAEEFIDVEEILSSQKTGDSGCLNGSWDPEDGGRVAATARNALRLIEARRAMRRR